MKKFRNTGNVIARSGENRDVGGEGNVIARRCFNTDVAISLIKESMNKESLFARAACFRRLQRRAFALLAMTIPVLVLNVGMISESWAACNSGDFSCNGQTGETAYCCYHIISQDEKGYNQNIEIYKDKDAPDGAEAVVGKKAFSSNNKISVVEIREGVSRIGQDAFWSARKLESITMPYVKWIDTSSFYDTRSLNSVDMPSVQSIGWHTFRRKLDYVGMPENANISSAFTTGTLPDCTIVDGYRICGSCGKQYAKRGTGCVDDCGDGLLGKEGQCIDSAIGCGINYKNMGGFCNKIKYTPAEAAEIAKDSGNVVTLTFRK